MKRITERQKIALKWICSFWADNGYSPSRAEMAIGLGMNPNGAQCHVEALNKKGFIRVIPGISRCIVVLVHYDDLPED